MDLSTGRLEASSRVQEYPSEHADRERRRRAPRTGKAGLTEDEDEMGPVEESEVHQLDDVV